MSVAPGPSIISRYGLTSLLLAFQLLAVPFEVQAGESIASTSPGSTSGVSLKKEEPKMAPPESGPTSATGNSNLGSSGSEARGSAPSGSPTSVQAPNNSSPGKASDSISSTSAAPQANGSFENYPTIGRMEVITFGNARPYQVVDQRLDALEEAVFKKRFNDQALFDRTQRLKAVILGNVDDSLVGFGQEDFSTSLPPLSGLPLAETPSPEASYLDQIAQNPENQKEADLKELQRFALELVNLARNQSGLSPLVPDELAENMASQHAADLASRNVLSHASSTGENPDLRYTITGGTDAITESVVSVKREQLNNDTLCRSAVAQVFKLMMARQDDRDAVLSPDATGLGFSLTWMNGKTRLVACAEISTKHGIMQPIAAPISVGDKVEVKGIVQQPYKFEKISLAWEGASNNLPSAADEGEEALPYFPPLDYVAFAAHAEHDYEKTMATLRTVGIIAAIAGGVFMPPVALAAPLIAMSGGMGEPKPLSDIPVHGGVKLEGLTFTGKIPFSNAGKDGIYYVTVWASSSRSGKSIPISRRAFQVGSQSMVDGNGLPVSKKHGKKKGDKGAEIKP
jgi:hypothetical protein